MSDLSTNATVPLVAASGQTLVALDRPAAPAAMHHHEAGRIVDGALQPAQTEAAA